MPLRFRVRLKISPESTKPSQNTWRAVAIDFAAGRSRFLGYGIVSWNNWKIRNLPMTLKFLNTTPKPEVQRST